MPAVTAPKPSTLPVNLFGGDANTVNGAPEANPVPSPIPVNLLGGIANDANEASEANAAPKEVVPPTPAAGINPWG
jgi:hypothetical protein